MRSRESEEDSYPSSTCLAIRETRTLTKRVIGRKTITQLKAMCSNGIDLNMQEPVEPVTLQ